MVEVRKTFVTEYDKGLIADTLEKSSSEQKYNPDAALFIEIHLHRLIKTEDWFKDGTTLVRSLRKGRGRNPYIDSTVKLRLKILVNDKLIVSNYPEMAPDMLQEDKENQSKEQPYDLVDSEDLKKLNVEKRAAYIKSIESQLYTVKMDKYELPSLLIKVIKS